MLHFPHSNERLPSKGVIQEIIAGAGHVEAAVGFALACAAEVRAAGACPRLIVWVRQDAAAHETGTIYGPGLTALGIDPGEVVIVRARTFADALRAGLEVLRCPSVGVGLIETIPAADLTASRRLKLAAEKSGVVPFLIRHADGPVSNAANIRWRITAGPRWADGAVPAWSPVQHASFEVELVKHPAGLSGVRWCVEWDHELRQFKETLSRPVGTVPAGGSLAA